MGSLVQNVTEFDYSVVGHFALKQILPGVPLPPVTPNQTFAVTNSSCSSFDVLSAVSDPNANLDESSLSVTVYPTTRGTVEILPDLTIKFTPRDGFLGTTCFGYGICDL